MTLGRTVPSGASVGVQSALAAFGLGSAASMPVRIRSPSSTAASFMEQDRIAASRETGSPPPASVEKSFQTPDVRLIDSDRPGSPDRLPTFHSWPSRRPAGSHSVTRDSRDESAAALIAAKSSFMVGASGQMSRIVCCAVAFARFPQACLKYDSLSSLPMNRRPSCKDPTPSLPMPVNGE